MLKKIKLPALFLAAIFLSLGLSVSLQSLFAAWTAPAANPPACSSGAAGCDAPLNTGSTLQLKNGPMMVNGTFDVTGSNNATFAGNVGIGTAGPLSKLSVGGVGNANYAIFSTNSAANGRAIFAGNTNTTNGIAIEGNDTGGANGTGLYGYSLSGTGVKAFGNYAVSASSNGGYGVYSNSGGTGFDFYGANANGKSYFAGKVGILTTSPTEALDVAGNVKASAFFYSSDDSLKKDIRPLDNSLSKVLKLEGVSFKWKDGGEEDLGVIAQEVEKIYPLLVKTDPESGLKSVQYGNLVAPLIEAIKEQQLIIEGLEARIKNLENK